MKKVFLSTLFYLIALTCFSQVSTIELDSTSGKFQAQGIIEFDSIMAADLYTSTLSFLPKAFVNAKYATQVADKEAGLLVIKSNFLIGSLSDSRLHFILTLNFKDNKFRYNFTDFVYSIGTFGETAFENKIAGKKKIKSEAEEQIKNLIIGLTNHVKKAKADSRW